MHFGNLDGLLLQVQLNALDIKNREVHDRIDTAPLHDGEIVNRQCSILHGGLRSLATKIKMIRHRKTEHALLDIELKQVVHGLIQGLQLDAREIHLAVGFQWFEEDRPFPRNLFTLPDLSREGMGVLAPFRRHRAEIPQHDLKRHDINDHRPRFGIVSILHDASPDLQEIYLHRHQLLGFAGWLRRRCGLLIRRWHERHQIHLSFSINLGCHERHDKANLVERHLLEKQRDRTKIHKQFLKPEDRRVVLLSHLQPIETKRQRKRIEGSVPKHDRMLDLLRNGRNDIRRYQIGNENEPNE